MAMAAALPRELVDRTIDLSYDTQALLAWSEVDRSARERSQRKVFEAVYLNTVSRTIAFYTAIWREWFSRSSRLAGFVRELSFDVDFSRPGRTSEQAQWIMCNGSGAFNFLITTCTQLNALAIVSAPFFHFEIQDPMLYTGTLPSLKSLTLCGDGSGALDMLENMEDFLQGIISMTPMLRRVTLDGLCAGPRTILSGTNSATFPQITSLRVNFSPAAVELMRPISPSFEREIGRILGSMFPNAKDIVLKLQNQSDVGLARGILAQLGPKVEYLDLSLEGLTDESLDSINLALNGNIVELSLFDIPLASVRSGQTARLLDQINFEALEWLDITFVLSENTVPEVNDAEGEDELFKKLLEQSAGLSKWNTPVRILPTEDSEAE